MNKFLSVREVSERLQKSEETIKRWIRSGRFPNAFKENDKQGWRIPEEDVQTLITVNQKLPIKESKPLEQKPIHPTHDEHSKELVLLAYQAVTMTSPTESMINLLSHIGIKRTLEILLIMQQSPNKVKNPEGFIKKAISQGWTPSTLPIKKERNIARIQSNTSIEYKSSIPFYNWLEERE